MTHWRAKTEQVEMETSIDGETIGAMMFIAAAGVLLIVVSLAVGWIG